MIKHFRSFSTLAAAVLTAAAIFFALPAAAQEWHAVPSPDGRLKVEFAVDQGEAVYRATFRGKPIIDRSLLGFRFKDAAPLEGGFKLQSAKRSERNAVWEQPWGETRLVREQSNDLAVKLAAADGRQLKIEFRVFDDGFGFRYILPGNPDQRFVISDELTQFAFAQNYRAWWIPAYREKFSEYEYARSALSAVSVVQTPFTLEGEGVALAIHEAALVDFASMNLRMIADNTPPVSSASTIAPSAHSTGCPRRWRNSWHCSVSRNQIGPRGKQLFRFPPTTGQEQG